MRIKELIKLVLPPIFLIGIKKIRSKTNLFLNSRLSHSPINQSLGIYWNADFANVLETWGEGNAWNEIQLLLCAHKGKVLDIACGTGKTMQILSNLKSLEIYGCDISDMLISKAKQRGIHEEKLMVCDATQLPYRNDEFDYAFSIGSIEHFTEDGILKFIAECNRAVKKISFHQHPVSRSGKDEGWLVTSNQSYFNNSVEWWSKKYESIYRSVIVLDSVWQDEISLGKWFVCEK